jgi:hypothetical protein
MSAEEENTLLLLQDLRCATCAFRSGTPANRSAATLLKAQLCAEIPTEFFCHERDGLCAGWVLLANKLNADGFHARQPAWKKKLKETLLECLRLAEQGENFDLVTEVLKTMGNNETEKAD